MEQKKVAVLLSAYNGEKYIAHQIDSILNQTYQNVEIYVRDDGSKDNTVSVVKKYEDTGRVHLEEGANCGFIGSFFWLVEHCGEADFYAYADQDDEWFPDKIAMALELLEGEETRRREAGEPRIPLLYFSNYDFYDGELHFIDHADKGPKHPRFANSLVDCMPLGFNTMFNQCARDMMRENIPKEACGHDWWTYILCQGLGKVLYDPRPTVKYRRHSANVSAGGMSFFKFQIWRFKKFFKNDYFSNVRKMQKEFRELYNDRLSVEDQKVLALFGYEGYHVGKMLQKVFYPHMFRQRLIDELMLRVIFLIGKL